MRTVLALAAVLLVMLAVRIALAEVISAGAMPSKPFAFLDTLPPSPPPLPPNPDREVSEWARKSWEIVPHVGWTMPSCQPAPYGAGACSGLGSGVNAGIGGIYRITPYLGLGAEVSLAEFRFDAAALDARTGASRAGLFGPIFRGYFLERGVIDPWVQVGFGAGLVQASYTGAGGEFETRATGAAVSAGAGVDFWLTPFLKLGPSLSQQLVFPSEVRVCQKSDCASYTVSEAGGVTRWLRLGLVATVAFGQEM